MAGRCTECGTYHHDSPPCDECGAMSFQPVEAVKACVECGAIHRGESPPCNECGKMAFAKVNPDEIEKTEDDGFSFPSASGSRRDFLIYGAGLVGVAAAGGYVFLSGDSYPSTTAPGNPDQANGIEFATAEVEVLSRINEERSSGDLQRAGNVDSFAEYWNKKRVKEGGFVPVETFAGEFNVSDYQGWMIDGEMSIYQVSSALELADAVFGGLMQKAHEDLTNPRFQNFGLDIHVDQHDGVWYVAVFA